jgi:hypothetical protein
LKFWMTARCVSFSKPRSAPQRGQRARETADPAHHATGPACGRIRNAPAERDPRQILCQQHRGAPQDQQRSEHGLEAVDVQARQKPHPHRDAGQASQHEGQEQADIKASANGHGGNDLPGQGAEDGQDGRQFRVQAPGPERHGHQAEGKS